MNVNHLRYFVGVVEHGSFREAAEVLCLSQPALSNSIKTLEDSLQVQLLDRGKAGVTPTPYGAVLYDFFKTALEAIARGEEEVAAMLMGSRGHIRIGAPTGIVDLILPEIIERLVTGRPGVTFAIRHGYLDKLLEALRHGELDFLLSPYWPDMQLLEDIEIERLAELSVSIYARAGHPLAAKSAVTLEDLLDADWIFADSGGHAALRQSLFGDMTKNVKIKIIHNHRPFMIRVLEKTDLLTIIPDYIVEGTTGPGALKRVNFPAFQTVLATGLIYVSGRHMTPAMNLFADLAREKLASV